MTIRQRLRVGSDQEAPLVMHCAHSRLVWNVALEQFNMWRKDKHVRGSLSASSTSHGARMRQLTEARAALPWLAQGSATVQQGALRDFERAIKHWLAGSHGRPTWRTARRHNSFIVRDLVLRRLSRKWAEVQVPKAGYVRFRLTRDWSAIQRATSARVTVDSAGRLHVSFVCMPEPLDRQRSPQTIGVDLGVTNSIALSDGRMLQVPRLSPQEAQRLAGLERRLARQEHGSARWRRTKLSLARMHVRLADRRRDWIERSTTSLVRDFDLIAVEDLRPAQMTRRPIPSPDPKRPGAFNHNGAAAKAPLNRAIRTTSWGLVRRRLEDKTQLSTSILVAVPARNTSRTCSACGYCSLENRKSQAAFECQACSHAMHADTNAARNILRRALDASSRTGDDFEGPTAAGPAVNGCISLDPKGSSGVNHRTLLAASATRTPKSADQSAEEVNRLTGLDRDRRQLT